MYLKAIYHAHSYNFLSNTDRDQLTAGPPCASDPKIKERHMFSEALARKLARIMAALIMVFIVIILFSMTSFGFFAKSLTALAPIDGPYKFDLSGLTTAMQAALIAVLVLPTLLVCYGLLGLRQTFLEAAAERTFSNKAVSGLRRFAFVSLVMVVVGVFQNAAMMAIFTYTDPNLPGELPIEFGSEELEDLFNTIMIFFVCHIFVLAKRTKDENDAFL